MASQAGVRGPPGGVSAGGDVGEEPAGVAGGVDGGPVEGHAHADGGHVLAFAGLVVARDEQVEVVHLLALGDLDGDLVGGRLAGLRRAGRGLGDRLAEGRLGPAVGAGVRVGRRAVRGLDPGVGADGSGVDAAGTVPAPADGTGQRVVGDLEEEVADPVEVGLGGVALVVGHGTGGGREVAVAHDPVLRKGAGVGEVEHAAQRGPELAVGALVAGGLAEGGGPAGGVTGGDGDPVGLGADAERLAGLVADAPEQEVGGVGEEEGAVVVGEEPEGDDHGQGREPGPLAAGALAPGGEFAVEPLGEPDRLDAADGVADDVVVHLEQDTVGREGRVGVPVGVAEDGLVPQFHPACGGGRGERLVPVGGPVLGLDQGPAEAERPPVGLGGRPEVLLAAGGDGGHGASRRRRRGSGSWAAYTRHRSRE